jgi:hypothetical protein
VFTGNERADRLAKARRKMHQDHTTISFREAQTIMSQAYGEPWLSPNTTRNPFEIWAGRGVTCTIIYAVYGQDIVD